ncbi:MAG: Cation transport protein [Thermomicrobiales bacterium]|jgi:Trk-type K+ transport system membrane component|nr:Cation transport protein [Thermomicrobiales bacterium]
MLNASHTHPAVTSSPSDLQAVTLFVWTALMFIGDASGSTAGGVKLTTVGVVAAALVSTLRGDEET